MGPRTDPDHPAAKNPLLRAIAAVVAAVLRLRLARAWLLYAEKQGPSLADGITYRALFSVFAGVFLGFSIAGFWLAGDQDALAALAAAVNAAIPGLLGPGGVIDLDAITAPAGLSITGAVSLVGLVGAAIGAVASLRAALRRLAGQVTDDVLWVWVLLRNLGLSIGIAASFAVTAVATVTGSTGLRALSALWGGEDSAAAGWAERILGMVVVLALDTALIGAVFVVLSGVRARARHLWTGALLGGVGLLALQQLSGLVIRGASANPLLASFAALIGLLLWLNLSAQVVLLACAWIITAVEDADLPPGVRADSFAARRLERAERALQVATAERDAAARDVRRDPSAD